MKPLVIRLDTTSGGLVAVPQNHAAIAPEVIFSHLSKESAKT
jgi:hypothetical protein